ncbi:flagellin N-terminal helical domain-containing protein [Alkaliphilus sp. B6464]|uniref:flagellin N-terminal helical domain-containing protein n=1 Tax=Alkaliphilus sp. B6464 TaxID=2731219 RepID=UPI001BA78530|nr:flagellin [Alkaliphilus sp. B6464]QUH22112.1 hypothetical protein HYG84_19590 [Alkaliphilus sp. B6464]
MRIGDLTNTAMMFSYNMKVQGKQISSSMEKISTGKQVNRAADSPPDILKISRYESQIRGSQQAQKNIQDSISMIQVADNSLERIEELGNNLRELATKYQSNNINAEEKESIKNEAYELIKEISHTIEHTEFNRIKIFEQNCFRIQTGPNSGDYLDIDMGKNNLSDIKKFLDDINNTRDDSGDNEQIDTDPDKDINTPTNPTDEDTDIDNELPPTDKEKPPVDSKDPPSDDNDTDIKEPSENTNSGIILPPNMTLDVSDGWHKLYNEDGIKIYEGNIKNGKFDGFGKWYNDTGELIYEGNFKKGNYDKYGKVYNPNTGRLAYEGDFKDNQFDKYGTLYYENGKIKYQGSFKDGKYDGYGTLYNEQGEIEYQGSFKDNEYEGLVKNNNGNKDNETRNNSDTYENKTILVNRNNANNGLNSHKLEETNQRQNNNIKTNKIKNSDNTGYESIGKILNSITNDELVGKNVVVNEYKHNNSMKQHEENTSTQEVLLNSTNMKKTTSEDIVDLLKDSDKIDEKILKPISNLRSYLGIQEKLLEGRLRFQQSNEMIKLNALSKIQDVNMAKEIMSITKSQILMDVNAAMMAQHLNFNRNLIINLLR